MGKLWGLSQSYIKTGEDPEILRGVCAAATYYVSKRILAGLHTLPGHLINRANHFMSLQRAYTWRHNATGGFTAEWVEMVARRDNIQADIVASSAKAGEVLGKGFRAACDAPGAAVAFLWFRMAIGTHAMCLANDLENAIYLFDANFGLWKAVGNAEYKQCQAEWLQPYMGKMSYAEAILLQGTPRDFDSLMNDGLHD